MIVPHLVVPDVHCLVHPSSQPDPDGSLIEGYAGQDVLMMNLRSLCFSRVATKAGKPAMWWDYADKLGSTCTSTTKQYTTDCAFIP